MRTTIKEEIKRREMRRMNSSSVNDLRHIKEISQDHIRMNESVNHTIEHLKKRKYFKLYDSSANSTRNSNNELDEDYKEKISSFLKNPYYNIITSIISVYSIFSDDLKLIFFDKNVDAAFSIIAFVIFALFTLEIILESVSNEYYVFGIYFWIDTVSTLSLIMDVHWIINLIIRSGYSKEILVQIRNSTRIIGRVFRILRFLRAIKLFSKSRILGKIF